MKFQTLSTLTEGGVPGFQSCQRMLLSSKWEIDVREGEYLPTDQTPDLRKAAKEPDNSPDAQRIKNSGLEGTFSTIMYGIRLADQNDEFPGKLTSKTTQQRGQWQSLDEAQFSVATLVDFKQFKIKFMLVCFL